jgi:hypothetical protein
VKAVTIPNATHYVHLDRADKGRVQFLLKVTELLEHETRAAATGSVRQLRPERRMPARPKAGERMLAVPEKQVRPVVLASSTAIC